MPEIPRPLNLPEVTILYGPKGYGQMELAQAIASLDNGLEFIDLEEPLLLAIGELFFNFGLAERSTEITEDLDLPFVAEGLNKVKDYVAALKYNLVNDFDDDTLLVRMAHQKVRASPILQDRVLFLNVTVPEEAKEIISRWGRENVLVLKCGSMNGLSFAARTIQMASPDPVERVAQIRNEIGSLDL